MHKIKIYSVGKTKESWLVEAIDEYIKRLTPLAQVELVWAKDDAQLVDLLEKESVAIICLDADGKMFNSEEFSHFLHRQLEMNGSRLAFAIGGSEGFSKEIKEKYPLVSLSKMTFTHQIARLVLVEQIYRAFEISKGTSYHK